MSVQLLPIFALAMYIYCNMASNHDDAINNENGAVIMSVIQ
jgi:hypothetical protein